MRSPETVRVVNGEQFAIASSTLFPFEVAQPQSLSLSE